MSACRFFCRQTMFKSSPSPQDRLPQHRSRCTNSGSNSSNGSSNINGSNSSNSSCRQSQCHRGGRRVLCESDNVPVFRTEAAIVALAQQRKHNTAVGHFCHRRRHLLRQPTKKQTKRNFGCDFFSATATQSRQFAQVKVIAHNNELRYR